MQAMGKWFSYEVFIDIIDVIHSSSFSYKLYSFCTFPGKKELLLWTWCIIILRHKKTSLDFENLVTDFQNWKTPEHNPLSPFFQLLVQIMLRKLACHTCGIIYIQLCNTSLCSLLWLDFYQQIHLLKASHGKHVSSSVKTGLSYELVTEHTQNIWWFCISLKFYITWRKQYCSLSLHFWGYRCFLYVQRTQHSKWSNLSQPVFGPGRVKCQWPQW